MGGSSLSPVLEKWRKEGSGMKWKRICPFILLLIFFLLFFYRMIFYGEVFLERDSFNFYYPLFEQIQQYWREGKIPLWDPLENMGQPLLANAASSVFYPVKLIFFLPFSYPLLFNIYHLFHYVLCLLGMYYLMISWHFSRKASLFSAMVYTFCGPVLILNTNVIFLVGASWLPLFIKTGGDLLREKRWIKIISPSLILSMMILGGDPEMGVLAVFFLCVLAFILWRSSFTTDSDPDRKTIKTLLFSSRGILGIILVAFILSAIQILPSREFSRYSDRNMLEYPSSIWEIPSFLSHPDFSSTDPSIENDDRKMENQGKRIINGIFCRDLPENSHQNIIYNFSVHPFQLYEFLTPDPYGIYPFRMNNIYYGEEENLWNYSLYSGIIPLIFVFSAFCFHRLTGKRNAYFQQSIRVWSSWMILFLLWGSMGKYGPYWIYRFFLVLLGDVQHLGFNNGDPVGGPYWFLVQIIPMFSSFRYSGKLMVPCLFFFAILAGWGWDHAKKRSLFYWSVVFFFLTLFMIGKHWIKGEGGYIPYFASFSTNSAFLSKKMWLIIFNSFIFTLSILSIWIICFLRKTLKKEIFGVKRSSGQRSFVFKGKESFSVLLLFMVGLDLLIANHELVKTLPVSVCSGEIGFSKLIHEDWQKEKGIAFPRYFLREDPPYFSSSKFFSKNYQEGYHFWRRTSLFPKWNTPEKIANIHYTGSLITCEYDLFLQKLSGLSFDQKRDCIEWMGTDYLIGSADLTTEQDSVFAGRDHDASVYLPGRYPQGRSIERLSSKRDRIGIFHDIPILSDPATSLFDFMIQYPKDNRIEKEYAHYIQYEENKIVLNIHLEKKADLVLSEQYFPGWKARISQKEIPIEKALGFFRKITLDPGDFTVEMVYAPQSFRWGTMISGIGWFLILGILAIRILRRNRKIDESLKGS